MASQSTPAAASLLASSGSSSHGHTGSSGAVATAASLSGSSGASLASSLALLAGHDTQHKIRDLLPVDTNQRAEVLLSLLKSSYSSSLHSADVRLASLTQELVAVRAQTAYAESKIRALEALNEEAARAGEEQRKRGDLLAQENVRLKADNQALRAENGQLAHFKTLLLGAAAGMPTAPPQLGTTPALQLGLPTPYPAAAAATVAAAASPVSFYSSQQQHQHHPQQPQPHSAADSEARAVPSAASQFFFSPVKSTAARSMHESNPALLASAVATTPSLQHQHQHATPLQPARPASNYVHVMPSPLSADALASPSPPSLQRPAPTPNGAADHQQHDILSEINAHLNGRSTTRVSSSPTAASAAAPPTQLPIYFSNHIDAAPPATPNHHERSMLNGISGSHGGSGSGGHTNSSGSGNVGLAEHARGLFQAAQARLPRDVFAEFVGLVQQFRALSSHGGNDARAWGEVRGRAAVLLAQHPDIYAHFEQLLHATQLQQQQQQR
jgi:hypothetical protein